MPRLPAALLIKALGRVGVEEEQEQQLNGVLRMLGAETPLRLRCPYSARHRPAKRQSLEHPLARRPKGRRVAPWPASWRRSASGSGSARSPSTGRALATSRTRTARKQHRGQLGHSRRTRALAANAGKLAAVSESSDSEVIAQQLDNIGSKILALETRLEEVEKVIRGLEAAALSTARALDEVSSHWDQVYRAMRRAE